VKWIPIWRLAPERWRLSPNVAVHEGDGAAFDPDACDAMLINAGVTHPHRPWLERLRVGGRLVLPLTIATAGTTLGNGVMARIVRKEERLFRRGRHIRGDLFLRKRARSAIGAPFGEGDRKQSAAENEVGAPGTARAIRRLPAARARSMSELRCFSVELTLYR
jgi:protein-L-isoaspartate O-methyltransferase